jgi:hypothetical protein
MFLEKTLNKNVEYIHFKHVTHAPYIFSVPLLYIAKSKDKFHPITGKEGPEVK